MPEYGENLESLFRRRRDLFTKEAIYRLGIKVLDILEQIHLAGYVYNDIKLDNLLLSSCCPQNQNNKIDPNLFGPNFFSNNDIVLIDFGFSTRYKNLETGEHLEKKLLKTFRGNLVFASSNQMKFHTTSRRDDVISLFYMLVYLLQGGNMPGGISQRDLSCSRTESEQ